MLVQITFVSPVNEGKGAAGYEDDEPRPQNLMMRMVMMMVMTMIGVMVIMTRMMINAHSTRKIFSFTMFSGSRHMASDFWRNKYHFYK